MKAERTTEVLGKQVAIVFSFDTTGSMAPCIAQVRQHLRDVVEKMMVDLPGLKIGLIAHGDYCDGEVARYRQLDLTSDLEQLMTFITNTPGTGGGDAPECYELVLHNARSLSWPKEGGSLVLIGDQVPHDANEAQNFLHLDWKQELAALKERGVMVFGMQCLNDHNQPQVGRHWEELSMLAGTPLLMLDSFSDATSSLTAATYATAGAGSYAGYLRAVEATPTSAGLAATHEKLEKFVGLKPVEEKK